MSLLDPRDGFTEALVELAREDDRIVVVVNDSVGSSKLAPFQGEFPDRMINVGIAEQNMVGVAAGLAAGGKLPFVSCAGSFLSARALEQIKVDVGYSGHPVVLCAQSPGMAYGNLGPTHHSVEDIAFMRAISGMTVVSPAGFKETRQAILALSAQRKPAYVRIPRTPGPDFQEDFRIGTALELREGTDVTIASHGVVTQRALAAAELLAANGIESRVLHIPTIEPLDTEAILAAARETGGIVVAEEATVAGALGGAIAEVTAAECPVPVLRLGVGEFAPTGSQSFLLDHFGMHPSSIAEKAKELHARL